MPLAHVPSLARGQVTPSASQPGQGDARPARYGQKRCRCMRSTTAGSQSASWRAGPAGHPAPSAALRCALGPALSASGTGRTWCTTRAARRPGQPNGTWPGRCWPGRAVALRGIEPVHSLGRRPSREHERHHALWDWGHRNARSSADLDGWRLLSDRQPRRADRVVPCSSIARICRNEGVVCSDAYALFGILIHGAVGSTYHSGISARRCYGIP
jgi:hypothetical protein